MNVELTILKDGGVLLISDEPYPDDVKRVEYYRDQSLLMVVYDDTDIEDQLMEYELPIEFSTEVEKSPNVIMCSYGLNRKPSAYKVPLVKVGELY